jgi:hypothetical protein
MRRILFFLLVLIIFTAAIKWYIPLEIRFNYYEVAMITFVALYQGYGRATHPLSARLKVYNHFLIGWCVLSAVSIIGVLVYPHGEMGILFFLKGLLQLIVTTAFFCVLVKYLNNTTSEENFRLLKFSAIAVLLSSIYGISQLVLIIYFNFDIDEYVTSNVFQMISKEVTVERYAFGKAFRINGFTGDPSQQGVYVLMGLPLMCYYAFHDMKYQYIFWSLIALLSLIFTMSGSSGVGLVIAMLFFVLTNIRKLGSKFFSGLAILAISAVILYVNLEEEILMFTSVKFSSEGTMSDHLKLAFNVIEIFLDHPLGLGYNNFSIVYEFLYHEKNFNTHNSWLTYLAEVGLFGLAYQIAFSLYIVITCFRIKEPLVTAFLVSYVGVCVAAIGYEVKNQFYFNLFTTLFFAILVIEAERKKNAIKAALHFGHS